MKFVSALLLALVTSSSLLSCADISRNTLNPMVSLIISDARCNDLIDSLPTKLEEQGFPFVWEDESQGLLTVGPITEDIESGSSYSKIQQTYFLKTQCDDELTTSISGDAILEGLNASGQWVGINDTPTIEHHSMLFLQKLDL